MVHSSGCLLRKVSHFVCSTPKFACLLFASGTVKRRKMGILHSIMVLKMGILHINLNIKMGILNNLQRYLLYTKDLRRDEQTILLPVMLTMFL